MKPRSARAAADELIGETPGRCRPLGLPRWQRESQLSLILIDIIQWNSMNKYDFTDLDLAFRVEQWRLTAYFEGLVWLYVVN